MAIKLITRQQNKSNKVTATLSGINSNRIGKYIFYSEKN